MRLKVRQLEIFHALAEERSVSRVARRLNITQPAVSSAVSKLEELVGFELFTRRDGAISLTAKAQLLHSEAEQAIIATDRVEMLADKIRAGERGVVNVSAYGAASIILLPSVIAEFAKTHPGVDVVMQVRDSAQVQKFVGDGQADLGIIEGGSTTARIRAHTFNLGCVCILPWNDPLGVFETITPHHLVGRPLVGVADNHSIDRQVERAFAAAGIELSMPIKGYFFASIRNLVRNGAGVAIVDKVNGSIDVGDGVIWRPFMPTVTYEMAVIDSPRTELSGPARDFYELLISNLEAHSRE